MVDITYQALALRWSPQDKSDHTFNITAAVTLSLFLVLALILSSIDVPVEERKAVVPIRDEVIVNIKERAKPIPKVVEPPKVAEPLKPAEQPQEEVEITRPRDEVKPLTREQEVARKKVEKIGIFRLKDQLAEMVDTASASNVVNQTISHAGAGTQVAAANTSILTAGVGRSSGGVSVPLHTASVDAIRLENTGQAAAGQVAQAAIKESPKPSRAPDTVSSGEGVRAEEDVVSVLDQNKSTLNTLYRKARRSNPGLKGRLVLEITVLASGSVANVIVKSSELNDSALEESIISRVKLLDFGAREGGARTVVYPIEFLPG